MSFAGLTGADSPEDRVHFSDFRWPLATPEPGRVDEVGVVGPRLTMEQAKVAVRLLRGEKLLEPKRVEMTLLTLANRGMRSVFASGEPTAYSPCKKGVAAYVQPTRHTCARVEASTSLACTTTGGARGLRRPAMLQN